jgi:C4-dicarboxylate-specific signal transduction histidine kinase
VREDPRFYSKIDKESGFETKSILCVPLKAKTKLIGVLEVMNKIDDTPFTEEDMLVLPIFAYQAAMAIENGRLYDELGARCQEEVQTQKSFAESEKFRALGQMASGMAHNFNNLLMSIQGNTSLIPFNVDSKHFNHEKLRNIGQSVQSGAELTSQLLGFAKGGIFDVGPTNLNDLIKRSSEMFGRTRKEIKVHREFKKNIWTVGANQMQLEQVLLNLQLNA